MGRGMFTRQQSINEKFNKLYDTLTFEQKKGIGRILKVLNDSHIDFKEKKDRLEKESTDYTRVSVQFHCTGTSLISEVAEVILGKDFNEIKMNKGMFVNDIYRNADWLLESSYEQHYDKYKSQNPDVNIQDYVKKALVILYYHIGKDCVDIDAVFTKGFDAILEDMNLFDRIEIYNNIKDTQFTLAKSASSGRVSISDFNKYATLPEMLKFIGGPIQERFRQAKYNYSYFTFSNKIEATTFVTKINKTIEDFGEKYKDEIKMIAERD